MNNTNALDLNIQNYSVKDIELFFGLKNNAKYTEGDIELKEYQIREQLLSSGHIDKKFKRDLIDFLKSAKLLLIADKNQQNQQKNNQNQQQNHKTNQNQHNYTQQEQDVIHRPETQYIYANPDEYFQGRLNPLNKRTITKCVTIDSRFRNNIYSGQSSDFIVQLPTKLNKVVSMQLASFEIPLCFYGISEFYGNNYFTITVNYNDLSNNLIPQTRTQTIVVPDGNYNPNDLVDAINLLMSPNLVNTCSPDPNNVFTYVNFVLDINGNGSGTGKLTLKPVGLKQANITNITLDFSKDKSGTNNNSQTNIVSKIGWNLGFIQATYSGATQYQAEAIIEPSSTKYIFLGIDDFNNSSHDNFVNVNTDTRLNKDIIARISLKGTNFSILMENNMNMVSEPRTYFGPVDIQKLRVRLYDEFGRTVQMNNANFSFCINVKMLYDL